MSRDGGELRAYPKTLAPALSQGVEGEVNARRKQLFGIAVLCRADREFFPRNPPMKTSLTTKGQIVLPAELRGRDRIRAGQQFEIVRIRAGEYLLRRIAFGRIRPGLLNWLRSCPEKNWFQPLRAESTADL